MKRLGQWAILAIIGCLGWATGALAEDPKESGTFPPVPATPVVGHRGFSFIAPENTLASIRESIKIGAQGCEMDIYQTTDGVIFLQHDGDFKRTGGLDAKTGSLSFTELRKLDAGVWKGPQFKGEKYPTFDEALQTLKGTKTRPVIEVKADGFEEKVVETIRKYDLAQTVIIIDFSANRVKKFRQLAPEICVAWLVSFKKEQTVAEAGDVIIKTLAECGTNVVDMEYSKICPELLKRLQEAGIHVWCWTVDGQADIERMVDLGVESVTTNRPDLALEVRAKKGK